MAAPPYDTYLQISLVIFILVLCLTQPLLFKVREDKFIKKRILGMVLLSTTVPSFFLILSLVLAAQQVDKYKCLAISTAQIIIPLLSVAPQLSRSISLWKMYALAEYAMKADIMAIRRLKKGFGKSKKEDSPVSPTKEEVKEYKASGKGDGVISPKCKFAPQPPRAIWIMRLVLIVFPSLLLKYHSIQWDELEAIFDMIYGRVKG